MAIPYWVSSEGTTYIGLVSSRKHKELYVLPKGGIEKGETGREAAVRELWEEAGLKEKQFKREDEFKGVKSNTVLDFKAHKTSSITDPQMEGFVPRANYEAHEIQVVKGDCDSELDEWPEEKERRRIWVTVPEALNLIEWRKDIHQLLLNSSLAA